MASPSPSTEPVVPPHLGGYVPGGDEATWFPELWEWMVKTLGVRSVLDVGCGEGLSVKFFSGMGCHAVGVEGVPQPDERIVQHDYEDGPLVVSVAGHPAEFDLAWSCEFVEHVLPRFVPNYLATFAQARLVAITHAFPGQPGHHHVNCQDQAYWEGALAAIGYTLDRGLTMNGRAIARANPSPWNHFARSGLIFRRWDP